MTAPVPAPPRLRIAVTGAAGLIGFHLRAYLHGRDDVEVLPIDRQIFHEAGRLAQALGPAPGPVHAVVHLAGLNRGDDEDIERTNVELADSLIKAMERHCPDAHLVFASSTHRDRDTAYGRSKRLASERFEGWAAAGSGRYTELILPNVFGEHGRPFHNSAVSTFCHQLVHGETPEILVDQEIEWLHAQQAAKVVVAAIESEDFGQGRITGTSMGVSRLLERLKHFHEVYGQGLLPEIRDAFDRNLWNTYRSYVPLESFPKALFAHQDPRGRLVEVVKTGGGGQCFFSTTVPGITRGEHFHRHKFERFIVIEGRARIRIRRLFSDEVTELIVDGASPAFVDMPTFHTHDLTNVGDETLLTLFWADEIFDPEQPDTVGEVVAPLESES